MGSANFMELQQRMQRELLGNPDMMRQILDNPLVQRLMSDPENMRNLITSNPQMQELMEVCIWVFFAIETIFRYFLLFACV